MHNHYFVMHQVQIARNAQLNINNGELPEKREKTIKTIIANNNNIMVSVSVKFSKM